MGGEGIINKWLSVTAVGVSVGIGCYVTVTLMTLVERPSSRSRI